MLLQTTRRDEFRQVNAEEDARSGCFLSRSARTLLSEPRLPTLTFWLISDTSPRLSKLSSHKEILGGTKPTSEACARKVPKAAKHRLPQDGRGRRRLLSTEGATVTRLPFSNCSVGLMGGTPIPDQAQIIIRVTGRSRYSRGTVHVQLLNLLTAVILFDSKLCAALAANRG